MLEYKMKHNFKIVYNFNITQEIKENNNLENLNQLAMTEIMKIIFSRVSIFQKYSYFRWKWNNRNNDQSSK
jgi:hypothetical protein